MVKATLLMLSLTAALGLAGCFTSDKPLVTDDTAVAPYAKITFVPKASPDDKSTFVRDGKSYVTRLEDGTVTMRFMALGDDLYLAESAGEQEGQLLRLYAVVKLDPKKHLAMTYKSLAHDDDTGAGLTACRREDSDMVCIEDVNAYVALAKAAIASGAKPDTVYDVTLQP